MRMMEMRLSDLHDNRNNTEFFYVYSKNFEWVNPIENERFGGHPLHGKVYRAAFNKDTSTYRLFVEDGSKKSVILLPSLKSVEGGFKGELVKITKENIMDFKLDESELDKIIKWSVSKEDIMAEKKPREARIRISQEEIDLASFMTSAAELYRTQYTLFDAVHELIEYMISTVHSDSIDELNLSLSKDFGAGLNIGKAFAYLSQYVHDDRRESLQIDHLMEAAYYLMNERARRKINEDE